MQIISEKPSDKINVVTGRHKFKSEEKILKNLATTKVQQ